MMGGTEADPGKDANKLTNKATLVLTNFISAIITSFRIINLVVSYPVMCILVAEKSIGLSSFVGC